MKHASPETLTQISSLLEHVRQHAGLRERKLGTFYRKSAAFLHFHEDPAGIFADVRGFQDWERFPVNTPAQQQQLLDRVAELLQVPA
ncbi:MAG: hypothetical protein OHK0037_33490 [Elainellaceae cyanobacterium]